MRGLGRRRQGCRAMRLGGGEAPRQEPDGGALDIALAAGDLARQADMRRCLHAQGEVEQARAVDEGVAMQAAQPRELGPLQPRDQPEHPDLLGMLQLGLKSDHVVERSQGVVLPQLNHRMRPSPRPGVGQAHRFHRPEAQRLRPALGHHLDRQAALEIGRAQLPILEAALVGRPAGRPGRRRTAPGPSGS